MSPLSTSPPVPVPWLTLLRKALLLLSLLVLTSSTAAQAEELDRDLVRRKSRWALLVGVDPYEDPQIVDLQFAGKDAKALGQALIASGSWDREHVVIMTADQENPALRPTSANIRAQLGRLASLSGADTVLFYFSGHGAAIEDGGSTHNAIFPLDTRIESASDTGIALPWLIQRLEQVDAPRRVLIFDACRNRFRRGDKAAPATWDVGSQVYGQGTQVLYSTRPGETSCEDPVSQMGHMTQSLVSALEGKADLGGSGDGDGAVDSGELYDYVAEQMRSTTSVCNQIPTRAGEWDFEFELVRIPPRLDPAKYGCMAKNEALRLQIEIALAAYVRHDGSAFRQSEELADCRLRGLNEPITRENAAAWHLLEGVRALYYRNEAAALAALRAARTADPRLDLPGDLRQEAEGLALLWERADPAGHVNIDRGTRPKRVPGLVSLVDGVRGDIPGDHPAVLQARYPDKSVDGTMAWTPGMALPTFKKPTPLQRAQPLKRTLWWTAGTAAITGGALWWQSEMLATRFDDEARNQALSCPGTCDTEGLARLYNTQRAVAGSAMAGGALALVVAGAAVVVEVKY